MNSFPINYGKVRYGMSFMCEHNMNTSASKIKKKNPVLLKADELHTAAYPTTVVFNVCVQLMCGSYLPCKKHLSTQTLSRLLVLKHVLLMQCVYSGLVCCWMSPYIGSKLKKVQAIKTRQQKP